MFFLEDGICGHFSWYFHAIRTRLPGLATILEKANNNKKNIYLPQASIFVFKTKLHPKRGEVARACICILINHATVSQSESLLEWFK